MNLSKTTQEKVDNWTEVDYLTYRNRLGYVLHKGGQNTDKRRFYIKNQRTKLKYYLKNRGLPPDYYG